MSDKDEEFSIYRIYYRVLHEENSMSIEDENKPREPIEEQNDEFTEVKEDTEQIVLDKNKGKILENKKTNDIIDIKEQDIPSIEDLPIFTPIKIDYSKDYIQEPDLENYNSNANIQKEFNTKLFYIGSMFKKIRGKVFKIIKIYLDDKFKNNGININFSFMKINQQMSKNENKKYLNMSLKELLKTIKDEEGQYILTEKKEKILTTLENDKTDKSFRIFLNTKIEDIYIKFFKSNEYQELIKELIDDDKYGYAYIHFFVKNAKKFVSYYKNDEKEDEKEVEENNA